MINKVNPVSMLYPLYEMNHAALLPARLMANAGLAFWQNESNPWAATRMGRSTAAALSMFERATRRYDKPEFNIVTTEMAGKEITITENIVWQSPFCNLLHFAKILPAKSQLQTKLLLVAPMSGHFSTLLRNTVEAMLPHYDVYLTDWQDARDVPVSAGRFDLDDYTDTVIEILHHLKTRAHIMAVCQPSVPVLAATALMAQREDALAPLSMVLMGGPIDTRVNPTAVNKLAEEKGADWFRQNMIMQVTGNHKGAGREVYAGFMQLGGFLSMNMDRHLKAHRDLYRAMVDGVEVDAERQRVFYDEYMAVMDLTAEFYLQTVDRVFVHHDFPNGTYMHRDEKVIPAAITKTALMTIEGERDDISGIGQTEAAHKLCSGIPAAKHLHHLQMGVGHYGVFSGSKFRTEVAPKIVKFLNAQAE
jgi:poly(3-hydroxybutyrate) depolymerase